MSSTGAIAMTNSENGHVRARLLDSDGRRFVARIKSEVAARLTTMARDGTAVLVSVDNEGRITGTHRDGHGVPLAQRLKRFRLPIDPPAQPLYVPKAWDNLIDRALASGRRPVRNLLWGEEATGKDTWMKVLVMRAKQVHGAERVVVLSMPPEPLDRFVGHLECKAADCRETAAALSAANAFVIFILPELESLFARADWSSSHTVQYQATLRDMLDGTTALKADVVLGTCNELGRLDPPLLSRFDLIRFTMKDNEDLARGILRVHWPESVANGRHSADRLLDALYRQPVANAELGSRKRLSLTAPSLTRFNGRFLSSFAADLERRADLERSRQPGFCPDEAFAFAVLAEHLEGLVAPLVSAAGTPAVRRFLTVETDPLDPIVFVKPDLSWVQAQQFVVS
jgi:hypothetical protein